MKGYIPVADIPFREQWKIRGNEPKPPIGVHSSTTSSGTFPAGQIDSDLKCLCGVRVNCLAAYQEHLASSM